jgi:tyrosyl-tRNA synthetase
MSISDALMWKYYALLTNVSAEELAARRAAVSKGELHPKQAKVELARMIVSDYHGPAAAETAAQEFERRFTRRELPQDLPEKPMLTGTLVEHLLLETGFAESGSDATRKIQQGAVKIDGVKFTAVRTSMDRREPFVLQVGRRVCRIIVLDPQDLVVSSIPGQTGSEAWIIMQNKGQVDVAHASRESALGRAREVAQALHGRVFVAEGERVTEDSQ